MIARNFIAAIAIAALTSSAAFAQATQPAAPTAPNAPPPKATNSAPITTPKAAEPAKPAAKAPEPAKPAPAAATPAKPAAVAAPAAAAKPAAAAATGAKVNLNTATAEDLDKLPQIGAARAKSILEARAKGKFKSWDDFVARNVVPANAEKAIKDLVGF